MDIWDGHMGVGVEYEDVSYANIPQSLYPKITWPADVNQLLSTVTTEMAQWAREWSGHSGRDGGYT
jgi:hypothetical protein